MSGLNPSSPVASARPAKTPVAPPSAFTWPSMTEGPRSPGVGEPLYQPEGAPLLPEQERDGSGHDHPHGLTGQP